MAGRLGHINDDRRLGHIPVNGIRKTNYAYGFGGCHFWLDASEGLNTKTDLAAVSSWRDKIGNIEFTQSTAGNQPRYLASDANFNNYPTVDFSVSTSRWMNSIFGLNLYGDFTLAFVAKYGTINNVNSVMGYFAATGQPLFALAGSTAGYTGITWRTPGTTIVGSGTTESTTTKIGIITNERIIVDGVEEDTYTKTSFGSTLDQLASQGSQTTAQLRGQIAEVIAFDSMLTSEECIRLSDNINSKYAIY